MVKKKNIYYQYLLIKVSKIGFELVETGVQVFLVLAMEKAAHGRRGQVVAYRHSVYSASPSAQAFCGDLVTSPIFHRRFLHYTHARSHARAHHRELHACKRREIRSDDELLSKHAHPPFFFSF